MIISFIKVSGYPYNWTRADVNGGNVLLEANGTLHLYFIDFKEGLKHVFHASAPFPAGKAPPTEFTYQGIALVVQKRLS